MAEWITQIDHQILLFIQEHLRFDWMTDPIVFISHLGNGAKIWILYVSYFYSSNPHGKWEYAVLWGFYSAG